MNKGIRIALAVVGLLVVAGGLAFVAIRLEPWLSADAAFHKAEVNAAKGKYGKAFRYIKMASDKKPGDAKYAWSATQLSMAVRNANAACFYAQRAWKDGRKERDVLQALVQFNFFSDKKQKLDYAMSLVNQMGANIDKDDLRASIDEDFGEIARARELREEQFNRTPLPALATKLGRLYLRAGRDSLALFFLQSCRKGKKLDDEGYAALARLYAKKGDIKEAERCYQEAGEVNKSSDKLDYDHALFLLATKDFDRATSMLDSLITKYPENKNLETARISAFMAKGDFNGALRECGKSSAPLGMIAPLRARILTYLNRLPEAEAAYDSAVAHNPDLRISLEFGNFLISKMHKSDKAAGIFESILKKSPSEQVANLGLATIALDAKDYAGARKRAEAILSTKNPTPLAYLVLAHVNFFEGKPQAALESCDKLLAVAPNFEKALFLKGLSYDLLGRFDKADEILTSLALKQSGFPEKSARTKRALVAIKAKQKKYDEALKLVDELDPLKKTIEFNRVRLEIFAFSGNYAKADETLRSIKPAIPKEDFLFYQSWLLELRGDLLGAASILESDLPSRKIAIRWALLRLKAGKMEGILEKLPKDSMKVSDWLQLASVTDKNKQYAYSTQFYKKAMKLDEGNTAVLNNYAYASMQTPGFNREEVLSAAKKAYMALSDRPEVLETYAEALIKCDKPADCIKLLQDKKMLTKQSANLLYLLGTAYEKTGDLRGAVSSYRIALAFPESTPYWPPDVSRSDLANRIEKLKAAIGKP